jgi:hypothetical protein
MNPILFTVRVAGVALLTAGGVALIMGKAMSRSSDMVAGALHFKRGLVEFQKGFESVFLGTEEPSLEEVKKKREAGRIEIQ